MATFRTGIWMAVAMTVGPTSLPARAAAVEPAAPAVEAQEMTLAEGLSRVRFLAGEWSLKMAYPAAGGAWSESEGDRLTFTPVLNDRYLDTTIRAGTYTYQLMMSFDRVAGRYRLVSRDDQSGLIDVYEGGFDGDGALVLTNLDSGTHYLLEGVRQHNRIIFTPTGGGGWTMQVDVSANLGASWTTQVRLTALPI